MGFFTSGEVIVRDVGASWLSVGFASFGVGFEGLSASPAFGSGFALFEFETFDLVFDFV